MRQRPRDWAKGTTMLLRTALGAALRQHRQQQQRSLRDVALDAGMSVGYLSEVERGRKEASSEVLAALARALCVTPAVLVHAAAATMAEQAAVADLAQAREQRSDTSALVDAPAA